MFTLYLQLCFVLFDYCYNLVSICAKEIKILYPAITLLNATPVVIVCLLKSFDPHIPKAFISKANSFVSFCLLRLAVLVMQNRISKFHYKNFERGLGIFSHIYFGTQQ